MQRKSGCCCPVSGATTTAQEAGAIPVTLGPPNIKAFAPNAHSYLNAHDFDRCVVVCCMQCYVCNTAAVSVHCGAGRILLWLLALGATDGIFQDAPGRQAGIYDLVI